MVSQNGILHLFKYNKHFKGPFELDNTFKLNL